MATTKPLRLWVRMRQDQKVSVAEYVRCKRCNVVEPFRLHDDSAIRLLRDLIRATRAATQRDVVLVGDVVLGLADALGVKCES